MSRIGQIRDVIVALGGSPTFTYYCDGPRSAMGPSRGLGAHGSRADGDHRVSYKIEGYTDGFKTRAQRENVVEALKLLPDVAGAYVTRDAQRSSTGLTNWGGNIRIVFRNRAR